MTAVVNTAGEQSNNYQPQHQQPLPSCLAETTLLQQYTYSKGHLDVFASPDFHFFIVTSDVLKIFLGDGEKSSRKCWCPVNGKESKMYGDDEQDQYKRNYSIHCPLPMLFSYIVYFLLIIFRR